jgi:hypothetical protein
MKVSLVFLLIFAACLQLQAAETTNPGDIIQKEGELLIADGSSYYRFSKNGVFDSGPLDVSGRTIRGEWKQSGDYFFVIEGEWSWANGISNPGDRRRLCMIIEPPCEYRPDTSKQIHVAHTTKSPPKKDRLAEAIGAQRWRSWFPLANSGQRTRRHFLGIRQVTPSYFRTTETSFSSRPNKAQCLQPSRTVLAHAPRRL